MQVIMMHVRPLIKAIQPNRRNVFIAMIELISLILLLALAKVRFAQYSDRFEYLEFSQIGNGGTI